MKKILSLLIILLLLSSLTLAFADQSSGEYLQSIGIIQGDENGNLNETNTLTRAELAKLIVSLNGEEENALKMNLSPSFSDAQGNWYSPYIGFAEYQGWVSGYPNGTFKPNHTLTTKEMTATLMNVLGYPYKWPTISQEAQSIGLVVSASNPLAITRGEAFDGIHDSLFLSIYNSDETLIESLGLGSSDSNNDFSITSYQTNNLVKTILKFNQEINWTSAKSVENYSFEYSEPIEITDIDIHSDNKTVILYHTAIKNSSIVKLNVEKIMNAEQNLMSQPFSQSLVYYDQTKPTIDAIDIVGQYKIYIHFSEPINNGKQLGNNGNSNETSRPYNKFNIKMDIEDIMLENDSKKIELEEDYELIENNQLMILTTKEPITFDYTSIYIPEIFQDYNNNYCDIYKDSYNFEKDKDAPVLLGYKDAYTTQVTLIYDEPIRLVNGSGSNTSALKEIGLNGEPYFYHTNENNNATNISVNNNEVTIFFSTNNAMPIGTAYLHLHKNTISDFWKNNIANDQNIPIEISADLQSTKVKSWSLNNEGTQLVIEFDDFMYKPSAEDTTKYRIYDAYNNDYSSILLKDDAVSYTPHIDESSSSVTLTFSKPIDRPYTLYLDNIRDASQKDLSWTIKLY